MVKEKKHLQEHYMTLTLGSQNVVQCPPNHMTYIRAKFAVATSNSYEGDAFTRKHIIDIEVKVAQTIAQYPLHHVANSPARFEVATSNR